MLDRSELLIARNCADDFPGCRERFVIAFEGLIKQTIGSVLKRAGSPATLTVEDLTQEVFLYLFENGGARLRSFSGKNGCSISRWLRTVAARRALNHLRRPHLKDQALAEMAAADDGEPAIDQRVIQREALVFLLREVGQLPAKDRLIFRMIHEDGCTIDAVAAVCKMQKGAVYTRVSRIKARLRKRLETAGHG